MHFLECLESYNYRTHFKHLDIRIREQCRELHQSVVGVYCAMRCGCCIVAPMTTDTPFYRHCLEQELARRVEKNPRYSLRAFARALQVDPGNFSRFMAGKAFLSPGNTSKVLTQLNLDPDQQQQFLESVFKEQSQKRFIEPGIRQQRRLTEVIAIPNLELEIFRVIGDWYHPAILELTFCENFDSDPKWIAQQLGITPVEAGLAVERLLNLNLLQMDNGKLRKTDNMITNTKDRHITTPALRRLQKQILEKASVALEEVPIEQRNQASMTMAIDPDKIPLAKQMIGEFINQLCATLASGPNRQVYQFTTGLFPLQKKENVWKPLHFY